MNLTMEALRSWANRANDNQAVQFGNQEQTSVGANATGGLAGRNIGTPVSPDRSGVAQYLSVTNMTCTGRTAKNAANEFARQEFLNFIYDQCELKGDNRNLKNLPENVRNAMKLNGGFIERHDWDVGKSRPLTARRIKAVLTALDENKVMCSMFGIRNPKLALDSCKATDAKEFWNGLDKGLRDRLMNEPKKSQDDHSVLFNVRLAYNNDKVRSLDEWINEVNTAYRNNPYGKIKVDVAQGTVSFE